MYSPRAPSCVLTAIELEPGLPAYRCDTTGGVWIDGDAYWRWVRRESDRGHSSPAPDAAISLEPIDQPDRAIISPRSGRLMRKFRVGGEPDFRVDFDSATGGFWLDAGELSALRTRGLLGQLHLIASDEWQRDLREAASRESDDAWFLARLGAERAGQLRTIAQGIRTHGDAEIAFAYLRHVMDEPSA